MEKIGLLINGLSVDEAKEIMVKVREIEQKQPDRLFLTQIKGLEHKSTKEVAEVIMKIFPKRKSI